MLSALLRRLSRRKLSAYDEQTFKVMDRVLRKDSVCIDVGAHVGSVLKEILRRAPAGHHFAFEPLPDCFATLQKRFRGKRNVEFHRLALAEKSGSTTFQHVVSRPAFSGIRRRRYDRDESIVEIEVRMARLDDIVPRNVHVDFVKVDVEGGEHGVFTGGIETLRRCNPVVVFEHGLGAADYYGVEPEQVFELLNGECRLNVSLMKHFLEGKPAFSRSEFANQFRSGADYYYIAYA